MTKRLMIYFFYDKDGIVDDYVPYFLNSFKPFCEEICVVVNGLLTDKSRTKLEKVSNKILIRENKGLDVEAYKYGLNHYGFKNIKENFDEVILANFTVYGPFLPLDEMFKNIEEQECDWWAPFKWYITTDKFKHMPSFFNVYKKRMISSDYFEEYWNNLPEINTYADAVLKHEQIQTKHWQNLGFKEGVWLDDSKYKDFWNNHWPLQCADRLIKEEHYPFIKRRCFYTKDSFIYEQLELVDNVINFLENNTNYDIGLIFKNLKRTQDFNIKVFVDLKLIKAFLLQNIHPKKENRDKYKKRIKTVFQNINYPNYLKKMIQKHKQITGKGEIL